MTTKIEWADETWNPVTGCTKVSAGCKNCYAERMAKRLAGRYGYPTDEPFKVTLHPEKLEKPPRWKKPRRVFVCSMSDLFHEDVPAEFIGRVWAHFFMSPQHTFLVLTKRPERMVALSLIELPNVWLGVTAEKPEYSWRIDYLRKTPAAVRFVSFEPLLASFAEYPGALDDIDWVIVGGETGPGARQMDVAWARGLRDQCHAAAVPFFFKQMSNKAPIPDDLLIREFPIKIPEATE